MFTAIWRSALSDRSYFTSSVRQGQDRGKNRRQFAADVSLLEERYLMSSNVLGGGHHSHNVALDQPGQPSIIKFGGYEWNANYNWSKDSGPYVNGQLWSPDNAVVEADGLHLKLANATIDGQSKFASADVELMAKGNGEPFHPAMAPTWFPPEQQTGRASANSPITLSRSSALSRMRICTPWAIQSKGPTGLPVSRHLLSMC
jgi:hypothetical protein